jgi:cation diffusion facilitator CzcD-associated flavoprotein CzcO
MHFFELQVEMDPNKHFSIVGCGFSGIAVGVKLIQLGHHNFTIFEKSGLD